MAEKVSTRMTASEFMALPESHKKQELISGEYVLAPSPSPAHNDIAFQIAILLNQLKPHGKVVIAPQDVYLDEETIVQPDVFWIAENSNCIQQKTFYEGAPELVVEVLSPTTAINDKREKFAAYEKHGVQEYWIADPIAHYLEIWRLQDKHFHRVGIFSRKDSFKSEVLGQNVVLTTVFPDKDAHRD